MFTNALPVKPKAQGRKLKTENRKLKTDRENE
jgi:hypothetical protein